MYSPHERVHFLGFLPPGSGSASVHADLDPGSISLCGSECETLVYKKNRDSDSQHLHWLYLPTYLHFCLLENVSANILILPKSLPVLTEFKVWNITLQVCSVADPHLLFWGYGSGSGIPKMSIWIRIQWRRKITPTNFN